MFETRIGSPWFPFNSESDTELGRLFCFPYGGGNAVVFREWQKYLPKYIRVYPVQLPGRGERIQEASYQNLFHLMKEMAKTFEPYLDRPFCFFGHSMGALISFEFARYLQQCYQVYPKHLFVSGYHAPHLPDPNPPIHHLPDDLFIKRIAGMNGTPKELLASKEFLDTFLPSLRADFKLCESYVYQEGEPLSSQITVFGGKQDPEVSVEMLKAWEKHTLHQCKVYLFSGDHFFIHSQEERLLKKMVGKLDIV